MHYTYYDSPIGSLLLAGDLTKLRHVSFSSGHKPCQPAAQWQADSDCFRTLIEQLDAYFAGELNNFKLPFALQGTPFQNAVWRALQTIPDGKTISYGQLVPSPLNNR